MKTFILIILLAQGPNWNVVIQEFHTKEACERAEAWLEKDRMGILAVCEEDSINDDPTRF